MQGIQAPALDRGKQRRALDELVARGGVDHPAREARAVVVGAAHPLQERRDAVRRADLAHQLHGPDVDTELERRGRHEGPQLAGPQTMLDALTALSRQRAVMGRHLILAQPLAQLVRHPLGQFSGVDEHQGGPMGGDVGGDAVEDLIELITGDGGLELAVSELQ